MKRFLIGLAVATALIVLGLWSSDDHQRFLKFAEQRDAWHRRCDLYLGDASLKPTTRGRECAQELAELLAYGRAQGWAK